MAWEDRGRWLGADEPMAPANSVPVRASGSLGPLTPISLAPNTLLGRGTGDVSALDASSARALLGLAVDDSPTFAGWTVTDGVRSLTADPDLNGNPGIRVNGSHRLNLLGGSGVYLDAGDFVGNQYMWLDPSKSQSAIVSASTGGQVWLDAHTETRILRRSSGGGAAASIHLTNVAAPDHTHRYLEFNGSNGVARGELSGVSGGGGLRLRATGSAVGAGALSLESEHGKVRLQAFKDDIEIQPSGSGTQTNVYKAGTANGEALAVRWTNDTTVGFSQYFLACYAGSNLRGGLVGNASNGVSLRGTALVSVESSSGPVRLLQSSTNGLEITSSGNTASVGTAPTLYWQNDGTGYGTGDTCARFVKTNSNTGQRYLSLRAGTSDQNGLSAPGTGCWWIAFRRNTNTAHGSITGSVFGVGTDYNETSDERLKGNIRDVDIETESTKLMAVAVARWNPRERIEGLIDESREVMGFIAQDLHEVVPEAAHPPADPDNPDDPWQVAPMRLIPYLVAACQHQEARILALEASQSDLLARLTALEAARG